MVDLISRIKQLYPTAIYDPPCTELEINEAEALIGMKFPPDLRMLYLHFNGFWISGYCTAVFPLLPRHHDTSTVGKTIFWRNDPYMPMREATIFYGQGRGGDNLAIKLTPTIEVVQFDPTYHLNGPEFFAKSILEAFEKDEQFGLENFGPPPWRTNK